MHLPAPKYSSMEVTSDNNDQRSPRRRFSFSASQESAANDESISLGQRSPLEGGQTNISLHPASQGVDERSRNSDASSSAHADDGAADSSDGLERTLPQWVAWKGRYDRQHPHPDIHLVRHSRNCCCISTSFVLVNIDSRRSTIALLRFDDISRCSLDFR
jgi:hypothetical protein